MRRVLERLKIAVAGWRLRLARQLGVNDLHAPLEWLVRLLFLPPAPGQPDKALERAERLKRRLAWHLAIPPDLPWHRWLLYLLLRAPPLQALPPAPRALALRRQIGRFWQGLDWTWRQGLRLSAALAGRLPAIDWERWGRRFENLPRWVVRRSWIGALLIFGALWLVCLFVTEPFPIDGQILFFLATWTVGLAVSRIPGRVSALFLICLSLMASSRYIWWRTYSTLDLKTPQESALALLLYLAEFYTWLILLLGYIQTVWPLQRQPARLPLAAVGKWPSVDVFIPSYNEPLSVVKPTLYAALSLDWPRERLNVYLLDDGTREEFRLFAESLGIGYIERVEHQHAKAGNINHALGVTSGEYIAIFDCDHIPTRSFLQTTMGWFLRDPKCAMIQTPHHFFSPDPFERNFDTFRRVPNEGSLFYGLIQDGNDFWNAAFFCGSCAVIKRSALLEVGGVAVETVTEDAHTALKLHRRGYNTAYLKVIQAAGLATESLASHVAQRMRWARGMAQIFRIDNPLLGKGLDIFQRLCYCNAMLHFFYGIPRLLFLTMPLAYLYFGYHVIDAPAITILFYVLPHIFHANLANTRLQGKHRHSYWAEVYESVLAWYLVLPTTIAFFYPKYGMFNVTAKGGLIKQSYFDWGISKPYLALTLFNALGIAVGLVRYLYAPPAEQGTVLLNLSWTVINLIMLGAAIGVATEARQIRLAHRVPMRVPAVLYLTGGRTIACHTENYSASGIGLLLPEPLALGKDALVWIGLKRGEQEFSFASRVALCQGERLGLRLEALSQEQEMHLIQCTFGRADAWVRWDEEERDDQPIQALKEVVSLGLRGYRFLLRHIFDAVLAWLFPPVSQRRPGE